MWFKGSEVRTAPNGYGKWVPAQVPRFVLSHLYFPLLPPAVPPCLLLFSASSPPPLLPPAVHLLAHCCFMLLSASFSCPTLLCLLLNSAVARWSLPPHPPPSSSLLPPVVASLRLLLSHSNLLPRRSLSGTDQGPTSKGMWIYFPPLYTSNLVISVHVSIKRNLFFSLDLSQQWCWAEAQNNFQKSFFPFILLYLFLCI